MDAMIHAIESYSNSKGQGDLLQALWAIARRLEQQEHRIANALEAKVSAPAPAPEAETVTISKAAFDEAIKVLKLALRNVEGEPQAATNYLNHAIGVLTGDTPPMPF